METAVAIKQNGKAQRPDVGLTQAIARALVQRVFAGETLFPEGGKVELFVDEGEGEKVFIISSYQIDAWCRRGNVVPGTGNELRAILNKAREDYRTTKLEKRRVEALENAEGVLHRALKIRTNLPVRNMFGQIVKREDGSIVRKENHNLLRVQVDVAKYVTERLDPDRWGKVDRTENKHLIFSLADLRKAKEQK